MIDRILTDLQLIYKDSPNRLKHVFGVRDKVLELGKRFDLDLNKLEIASLLHDITKYYSEEKNVKIIQENFENSDQILREFNKHILHAFSAKVVVKNEYGITDDDILNSIECHTVGKPNMNMYEKVLFIADYTEVNRTYDSCIKVRKILEKDIDLAVYTAIDDSILFYENINDLIPKTAYEARKYYKELLEVQNG